MKLYLYYIYIYNCLEKNCMYKPPKCFKGITMENNRKTIGKTMGNHRKTMGKAWDIFEKLYENHGKTMG